MFAEQKTCLFLKKLIVHDCAEHEYIILPLQITELVCSLCCKWNIMLVLLFFLGPVEQDSFDHELRGVIPRGFEYLFNLINREREKV